MYAFQLQAGGGLQVSVGKINAVWDTAAATWNAKAIKAWPQVTGASYNYGTTSVPAGSERWKEFDVTSVINELVRNPASNNGFVLRQSGQDAESFYTSDFPDVVYRPRLVVTYDDGVDRVASPIFSAVNPVFIGSMQQAITCPRYRSGRMISARM